MIGKFENKVLNVIIVLLLIYLIGFAIFVVSDIC